jgi:multidrug efflux pump
VFSRFFIDRPIFAAVLSIVITLAGALAARSLPIAQYPQISPPNVSVECTYPGASAQVVAETVAAPIEQQVNGVEHMMYMSSQCTNDGSYTLTITFELGVDLNLAQVMVQNRVALALPLMPDVIKQTGVATKKKAPDILMAVAIYSRSEDSQLQLMPSVKDVSEIPAAGKDLIVVADVDDVLHFRMFDVAGTMVADTDENKLTQKAFPLEELKKELKRSWPPHELSKSDRSRVIDAVNSVVGYAAMKAMMKPPRYDQLYLSNYAMIQIQPELARLPGISDVTMLGQRDYSMRIWVDPDKLAIRNLTAGDVVAAIREQNQQVATGQIGQQQKGSGQRTQVTTKTIGRLTDVSQFENIVVKATPDGRYLRIKDIGRVELGAKNSDIDSEIDGMPGGNLAVFQLPEANALECRDMVIEKMEELKKDFPEGLDYVVRYDTTPFIRESIIEVFYTLRDAVILVALVVLLFLQNWRSALIPLIAVPVAIVGTFAVMAAMGFSVNNLTLFGLVLAIGIVVDDAIVVVESVEHHIEHGMKPRAATLKAMDEVSAPVIAVGLVLTAVFVPCAFITGITGQFFRQFALTIASSTIISTFNSLTLSPALAAILLKPKKKGSYQALPVLVLVILGCWMGYTRLGPRLEPWLASALPSPPREWLSGQAGWVGLALGGLIGLIANKPINWLLGQFFRVFNWGFDLAGRGYTRIVGGMLRVTLLVLLMYVGMLCLTGYGYSGFPKGVVSDKFLAKLDKGAEYEKLGWMKPLVQFTGLPKGFIPSQDMGYLMINVQLPDSASSERTFELMRRMQTLTLETPGSNHTMLVSGQSMLLSAFGSNFGSMFVMLKGFDERPQPTTERFFEWYATSQFEDWWRARLGWKKPVLAGVNPQGAPKTSFEAWCRKTFNIKKVPSLNSDSIANVLRAKFREAVPDADIAVLPPPPVRGVGRAGGFKIMIEDRSASELLALQNATDGLVEEATFETDPVSGERRKRPEFSAMSSVFRANVPQVFVDLNRSAAMTKEVELNDIFQTLQVYLGSVYVNDFNLFGRTWQVIVQCDSKFRDQVEDIQRLKIRNLSGQMVPLGSLAEVKETPGPFVLTRYNMFPAAFINGAAAPGTSSRQALDLTDNLAAGYLPPTMATEWTEMAYLELAAGNTAMYVFGCAVVAVFLVLAAQYESWSLPLAVILVVPLCLLSAMTGVWISNMDINIFTQIGFVVLVGLASKNAILIVEFAKVHRQRGLPLREATLEACRLRLRPIVMTSMAFILGVVPLLLSTGAGAEMRRTLGTAVFSGMLGVTAFGIFLTPVFFFVVDWLGETPLFASGPLRKASDLVLGILSLRALRSAIVQKPRPTSVRTPAKVREPGELVEHK